MSQSNTVSVKKYQNIEKKLAKYQHIATIIAEY